MKPPGKVCNTWYRASNGGGGADGEADGGLRGGTAGRDGARGGGAAVGGSAVADAELGGLGGSVRRGDSPGRAGAGPSVLLCPADDARSAGIGTAIAGGPGGTGSNPDPGARYALAAITSSTTIARTPIDTRIQGGQATAEPCEESRGARRIPDMSLLSRRPGQRNDQEQHPEVPDETPRIPNSTISRPRRRPR
ncbi:hypothetical protein Vqi01_58210 [Micromonospora qiuiae]|uniref:PE-PGRS family protein n=1 Tax=Micromonospora qiuiae TaxID=502268 RepID=A0ABQ4JMD5_9ACTN|nr:hypothetical protein Vqi01_58210 [Micromonospora qiuiae]